MISANVEVVRGWGEDFARRVNAQVALELAAASREGAEVAAKMAAKRRRTGGMELFVVMRVEGTPTGWVGGFQSQAFYSGFQSRGTLASRKRKLKASTVARRSSRSGKARYAKVAGSSGIKPLRHEEAGLAAAKKSLVARLNRI